MVVAGYPKISLLGMNDKVYVKHINVKNTTENFESGNNNIIYADVDGHGSDGGGYIKEQNLILVANDPFNNDIIG